MSTFFKYTVPCPTCRGYCCDSDRDANARQKHASPTFHCCEACEDGIYREPISERSCGRCLHGHREGSRLLCRRYPPVFIPDATLAQFPEMRADECCGEWAAKEKKP